MGRSSGAADPLPSYEAVAGEHWYPQEPRSASMQETSQYEVGHRFLRSVMFLADRGCFHGARDFEACCVQVRAADPESLPRAPQWCFDELYTEELCCGKEWLRGGIFEEGFCRKNASRRTTLPHGSAAVASMRTEGCIMLRALYGERLLPWLQGLLALPGRRQAACAAGALATRFSSAAPAEVIAGFALLEEAVLSSCPDRRMQMGLRRGAMLWMHRALGGVVDDAGRGAILGQDARAKACHRFLMALDGCRRALVADGPVVFLHMPKTAGASLCGWAKASGLPIAMDRGAPCFFYGDGPFWLGQAGWPASCRQRLREAAEANVSWTAVERWIDLPLCGNLRYAVVLREPVARLLNHFRHLINYFLVWDALGQLESVDMTEIAHAFFCKLWRFGDLRKTLRGRIREPAAHWLNLWLGMSENYQVRSLAGAGGGLAYFEDGSAAALRLGAAIEVLEQLDAVIVLGKDLLGKAEQHLLRHALQMPGEAIVQDIPFASHGSNHTLMTPYAWSPGERKEAHDRNEADIKLVRHARLLGKLDRAYFAMVGAEA